MAATPGRAVRLAGCGLLLLAAGACGGTAGPAAAPQAPGPRPRAADGPDPAQFLSADRATQTVHLTLLASDGPGNNGFNFDGYGRGELVVRVPRGWRVVVRCVNRGALLESCAVVSGPGATTLAFHGASTPDPLLGMTRGSQATFSFRAARAGTYRLASLVPGHEQARMYAVLVVAPGGRPAISARPGP